MNVVDRMRAAAAITLAAASLGLAARAQAPAPAPVETTHGTRAEPPAPTAVAEPQDAGDMEFLLAALSVSLDEVRLGELAERRSTTPSVRALGAELAVDHAKRVDEIRGMLSTLNVTPAAEPEPAAEERGADLAKLSGAEFDAAFLKLTADAHERAIARYEARAAAKPGAEIALWAEAAVPMLQQHLAAARRLLASS